MQFLYRVTIIGVCLLVPVGGCGKSGGEKVIDVAAGET